MENELKVAKLALKSLMVQVEEIETGLAVIGAIVKRRSRQFESVVRLPGPDLNRKPQFDLYGTCMYCMIIDLSLKRIYNQQESCLQFIVTASHLSENDFSVEALLTAKIDR